ncbi:MAG: extracellular solute-binding protein [Clostridia bacterium]|nr:extracellular solute-binding protein [Clostridia bacterium]
MKKSMRYLCAWLCTLLVIPTVMSCADEPKENVGDTTPLKDMETTAAETVDPERAALDAALAKLDGINYNGYEFRTLDRSDEKDANWETLDVYSEAEDGDTIHDAVYQRNRMLEERLNIKFSETKVFDPYVTARTAIMSDADDFDIFTDGLSFLATMAVEGYLADLNTVEPLKLNEVWWDQDMNKDLSISGKRFFCTGDISIMDNYGTWCVMFNKDIASSYDLPNIYEMVQNGSWTMDEMWSMAKTVTKDVDGNAKLDNTDQWGFLTESYNVYGLWASSGEHITSKDANDHPLLTAYNERSIEVMQDAIAFTQDSSCTLLADTVKEGTLSGCAFTNEHFGNGNALFIYGGMWLITKYRAYDVNFGVVPAPKWDASQTRYYNTYSGSNCTAYSIPTTSRDLNRTGTIMEAMAEVSKYTLTPAYYDVALKGKYIRDEESAAMLDIILAQRSYDLGGIFNWGNIHSTITGMAARKNADFASSYAKIEKSALKAIEKFIDSLQDLE